VGNRETYTATITNTVVTTYAYDAANRLVNAGGVAYTWSDAGRPVFESRKARIGESHECGSRIANRIRDVRSFVTFVVQSCTGQTTATVWRASSMAR
jgi:hypothetical protein